MKWEITDLKGVGDVELDLSDDKRVFVFLGNNGVGKTKILESLMLVHAVQTKKVVLSIWIRNNKLFQHIDFCSSDTSLSFEIDDSNWFDSEQKTNKPYDAFAYLGANKRGYLDTKYHQEYKVDKICYQIENAIKNEQISDFGMNQNIHDWFLERAKSVNPYQKAEDNRKVDIDTVLKSLHQLDNRIDASETSLKIDLEGHVYLTIEGQQRELSELSSGFMSVLKIIQSIVAFYSTFTKSQDLLNVKGVVLIDEIESHLHVEWQTKIIPTLKNLFKNTTFYITTHSPLVLSQLQEGEAYLLQKDKDGVVRSEMINSPNTRLLENVLQDTFNINLNELKRQNLENIDQSKVQEKLLKLLGR